MLFNVQDAVDRGWFCVRTESIPQPEPDIAAILNTAWEIAGAMAYLHQQGILHGDLTGGNVLLSSNDKDSRGFVAKVLPPLAAMLCCVV